MKKRIWILPLILSSSYFSQEVISCAGKEYNSNGIALSWTIGEPVTSTINNGNTILTQGFQQSNLAITAVKEESLNLYKIYPNPTRNRFTIEQNNSSNTVALLHNLEGKLMKTIQLSGVTTSVYIEEIPAGVYILTITNENKNNIFKIIKNN